MRRGGIRRTGEDAGQRKQNRCYKAGSCLPRIRKEVFRALKGTPRLYCPSFMFEFFCVLSIYLVFIEIPSESLVIESNNPLKPLQILLIRVFMSLQSRGAVSKPNSEWRATWDNEDLQDPVCSGVCIRGLW